MAEVATGRKRVSEKRPDVTVKKVKVLELDPLVEREAAVLHMRAVMSVLEPSIKASACTTKVNLNVTGVLCMQQHLPEHGC